MGQIGSIPPTMYLGFLGASFMQSVVICYDNYYKRMKRAKNGGNSFQMAIVWHFFKLKGLSFGANQVNSTFHIFDNLIDFARCKS